ncbi:hypothetical protein OIB37_15100 [Streptomyces sp. NBC_00820]|uniref:hypothetical protein n=1 Tax=Streptomyces sp. NBC_00820 TaxID=2975842 RepID=UPI002ED0EC23|nr:hypothetical protein OIB37_15100 [Streptomyces sp. NBC_00820]
MGGETEARGAAEAGCRTCLRCDNSLRTRRIPRLFCSRRHAAESVTTMLVFGVVAVRVALHVAHGLRWIGVLG